MITRPLDLASKVRAEPRSFDWLFYVNVGLLALFFSLFGSRFVLAPGVSVLPAVEGSAANARTTTHYISVRGERQIFAGDGLRNLLELNDWLVAQARTVKHPVLLVQCSQGVDLDLVAKITSAAQSAGFTVHIAAVDPTRSSGGK